MIPYYCQICHQLDQEGILGHATNRCGATNHATNESLPAGDEEELAKVEKQGLREVVLGKTLNRRSREAYNAYQKEYMRRRRGH